MSVKNTEEISFNIVSLFFEIFNPLSTSSRYSKYLKSLTFRPLTFLQLINFPIFFASLIAKSLISLFEMLVSTLLAI